MDPSQGDNTGDNPDKKKSGGQPGNQNARKATGLYVRHMSKRQQERFEEAKMVTGLKEEMSVVRSLLDWAIGEYPEDYRLHMKLISETTSLGGTRFWNDSDVCSKAGRMTRNREYMQNNKYKSPPPHPIPPIVILRESGGSRFFVWCFVLWALDLFRV